MAWEVCAAISWRCVYDSRQLCAPAASSGTHTRSQHRRKKSTSNSGGVIVSKHRQRSDLNSRGVIVSKHRQRSDLRLHSDTTDPTTVTVLAPREEYAGGSELAVREDFTLAEFFDRNNTFLDGGSEIVEASADDASSPLSFMSEFQNESVWEQKDALQLGVMRFCEGLLDRGSNRTAEADADEQKHEQKERKGIPAVMRCFDRTKIYVNAGNGGNGVVAFRREKFVPYGGPSGGNGGEGGSVYIEVDPSMNSLLPFRKRLHFRAGRGGHGQGKCRGGAKGEDCVVKVPPGTLVKGVGAGLNETETVLLEMRIPGQRALLLPGGRGGRGNAAFKSSRNKAPQLAENGEEGAEIWVELELKLVADVGIIGVPNAGKSTLLSSISSATPNIADYPFTTLLPNLGVVSLDFDDSMLVADLPGLLKGAHSGIGLGHEFLRHAERCHVLIHMIDGTSPQPEHEYEAVRSELNLFNPSLALKPSIVAFNKMDISNVSSRWKTFEDYMQSQGVKALCISAATKHGTSRLIQSTYDMLKLERSSSSSCDISGKDRSDADVGKIVRGCQNAPIERFWVTSDKHQRIWQVHGAGLERFTQMTNWEYYEAVQRFQRVLDASGVSSSLRDQGVQEGDTIIVGQMEYIWRDSDDIMSSTGWKRGSRGSKVWPH